LTAIPFSHGPSKRDILKICQNITSNIDIINNKDIVNESHVTYISLTNIYIFI